MIAYNTTWLDNVFAREQLKQALAEKLVDKEEVAAATAALPVGFYSPNIFIRAGLFILTIIVVIFSVGLLALLFLSGGEDAFRGLAIFCGLACYAALEWVLYAKQHYQSGVDDALMWSSGILIFSGISAAGDFSPQANAFIVFVLALYFTLRFADRVMALVSILALLAVVLFVGAHVGGLFKLILPFVLMLLSAVVYFVVAAFGEQERYRHYHAALAVVETAALVCFYLAGNYYVVREAGVRFLGLHMAEGQDISLGWLFWFFTVVIPALYILAGIKRKNIVLIRTGVLLIAMVVFTIRAYHHILPIETAMLFGGMLLVGVSYLLNKMLKQPRGGFTSSEAVYNNTSALQNIESIVIAETLSTQQQGTDQAKFGGGSFGGGGASAEY